MDIDQNLNGKSILRPEETSCLKYEGEDDHFYSVIDRNGAKIRVHKNRSVVEPSPHPSMDPLTPAFRLLAAAFLGLAPAGLGTLVLAPLALLWTIWTAVRFPPDRTGWIRIGMVWILAAILLILAVPLSLQLLNRIA
jgi:hypothetical protein